MERGLCEDTDDEESGVRRLLKLILRQIAMVDLIIAMRSRQLRSVSRQRVIISRAFNSYETIVSYLKGITILMPTFKGITIHMPTSKGIAILTLTLKCIESLTQPLIKPNSRQAP